MKRTITLRWRTLGFAVAVALALLLAITPDNLAGLARGGAGGGLPADMPADGFAVDPAVLAAWIDGGTPLSLVDVRERWAYDEYHIDGALHVPMVQVVTVETLDALHDDPIVVVASNDVTAGHVVAVLRVAGRDAWALRGGLAGWWDEVLRPASLDASIPPDALADESARRAAWRNHFLGARIGDVARPTVTPTVPASTASPTPAVHGKSKAKRGKGC